MIPVKLTRSILAFFVTLFVFGMFFTLIFKNVDSGNRDIILFILGAAAGYASNILGYYFGDSENKNNSLQ